MIRRASIRRRRGLIFPCTLWVVTALTALALALACGARMHRRKAGFAEADMRTRQIEQGALQYVLRCLDDNDNLAPDEADMPCCGVSIGDGAFWIVHPDDDGDGERDYGLADEGGKIDLNTAPAEILEKLPGGSELLAAAIVDWRDGDDETTSGGAESDTYLRKTEAYRAKNAPFESVLELRLVADADDETVWGEDTNLNGFLDDNENDGDASDPDDDRDGSLDRGLAGWTTAYLQWPDEQDEKAVDPNSARREEIQQALGRALAETRAMELSERVAERRPFTSLFDLADRCGVTAEEFEQIETALSIAFKDGAFRLNVNAAPAAVLACLPGLDAADAQTLVQAREAAGTETSMAWMLDAIDRAKLVTAAAAGVTGRAYQYTADIVSVSGDGRTFRRTRYVIDVSDDSPRIIHRLDLSHRPWPLDAEILERLRAGEPLDDVLADQ